MKLLIRHKIRTEMKGNINSGINDSLNYIDKSGKKMNRLIEDVLEYSKLSSHINREREIINLEEMVQDIIEINQNLEGSKSVTFETYELPNIKWYYSKIFLLMKNIIENGIKYNTAKRPIIKVYGKNELGVYSIHIEDNGIGIEKEYFEKIFVMFNRLHTETQYEGTGLGLATCKKIVEEFEGKISISSKVNVGTAFKIKLPSKLVYEAAELN